MRKLIIGLAMTLAAMLALGGIASAQTAPEFKLGFKALADQIPDIAGQALENEHWGANGDSLEMTTNGLMAWRKADNWTAFTSGSHTWVNGPFGVQDRPNEERFDWEAKDPPVAAIAAPADAAPAPAGPPPAPAASSNPAPPKSADHLKNSIQQLLDAHNGSDTLDDMDQLLQR